MFALNGTTFTGEIPYLVSLHKYSNIICIDADKGILERDHMYAQQLTTAVLSPLVSYYDLVYMQHIHNGFIWWTRAHGNRFEQERLIPAEIPDYDRGRIVRDWYEKERRHATSDEALRAYERKFGRKTKYSETLSGAGLAKHWKLMREEQEASDIENEVLEEKRRIRETRCS